MASYLACCLLKFSNLEKEVAEVDLIMHTLSCVLLLSKSPPLDVNLDSLHGG